MFVNYEVTGEETLKWMDAEEQGHDKQLNVIFPH